MTSLLQPRMRYLRVRNGICRRATVIDRGRWMLPIRYRWMFQILLHLLVNVATGRRCLSSLDYRQRWIKGQGAGQHLTRERHS